MFTNKGRKSFRPTSTYTTHIDSNAATTPTAGMALKHRTDEFVDGAGGRATLADQAADVLAIDRHTDFIVRNLLTIEGHGGTEVLGQVSNERLSDVGLLLEWHGGLVAHVLLLSLVGVLLVVVALLGLRASGRTPRLSPVFGLLSTPVLSVRRPLTTLTLATTPILSLSLTASGSSVGKTQPFVCEPAPSLRSTAHLKMR